MIINRMRIIGPKNRIPHTDITAVSQRALTTGINGNAIITIPHIEIINSDITAAAHIDTVPPDDT